MTKLQCSVASAGRFRSWAATHPGAIREVNQDRFVNRPDLGVWAVADGAGGHGDGQYAAGLLAEALETLSPGLSAGELLAEVRGRIFEVHETLHQEAAQSGNPVTASTIVVLLSRDDHFACLWAGDSRAYLMRSGILDQITRDHSLVQELVDAGTITAEEAGNHPRANVITRAVGAHGELELEKVIGQLSPSDRFLLCSDGLFKSLPEPHGGDVLSDICQHPAEDLLRALAANANDNLTVVVVDITSTAAEQQTEGL